MPLILAPDRQPPDLRDRLGSLRRLMRWTAVVHGGSASSALVLAGAVAVGALDAAVNLPALVRAVVLVGLLVGAGWLLFVYLLRPWRATRDELTLALHVESHFPALNDALASAIQFRDFDADDAAAGSLALREETRRRARRAAEDCDFGAVVDGPGPRRALAAAALAAAAALVLVVLYPAQARTALVRLADPFGDHPWPPQTALSIDAPTWLARGEAFVLRGELRGVIPERVGFAFGLEGAPAAEQGLAVTPDDDGSASVTLRLEPNRVPRTFRYQVRANDSVTPWRTVKVLPPPQLVQLDGRPSPQIHLDFPAYTGLTALDLPDGGGHVEGVTGTLVRLRAATDRPVARAWVELAPDPPRLPAAAGLFALAGANALDVIGFSAAGRHVWGRVPAALSADGHRLWLEFRPPVSGRYALVFADESGLAGRCWLDVRVLTDPSPAVTLDRPSAGQDSLSVLPTATVTVRASVEDVVFAVRSTRLEYRAGPDEPRQRLPLFEHGTVGTAVAGLLTPAPVSARLRPQRVAVEHRLELRQLRHADGRPLADGDTLTLQVVADDFDDVTVPKDPGRSHEVELRIVTPSALQAAVQKAEADIQRELKDLRDLQADARQRARAADDQRRAAGQLRPEDQDRLVQSEQMQQQLRQRLGNDKEGLRAAVDRLRQMLRDNPLPRSPERDRLDALAAELGRLAREELPPIEPLIAATRKERGPVPAEDRKSGPLPKALEHQRESERTLNDLLDRLQPWTDARELRAEAAMLERELENLNRQRAELAARDPGGLPEKLPPEVREELNRLQERQAALTEKANDLIGKLNRKADEKTQAAGQKDNEHQAAERKAAEASQQAEKPPARGTPQESALTNQARTEQQKAADAKEAAEALRREADAIRSARDIARGNVEQKPPEGPRGQNNPQAKVSPSLPEQLREAGQSIGDNKLNDAKAQQEAAAGTLQKMQQALAEQDNKKDDADRLIKKLKEQEQQLEQLIEDQERLQKRVQQAQQIADPAERKQALEQLGREQEQLEARAREMAQRLSRLRGEEAARELRRAGRAMDQAQDQMDQGERNADNKQEEALDRLDDAQDELARARQDAEEQLQREMRAKLLDAIKGLRERQAGSVAESERIFQEVKQKGGWDRALESSLIDVVGKGETNLGQETGKLVEKEFKDEKVIAHMVHEAADKMIAVEAAIKQVRELPLRIQNWESDRTAVQKPQRLALRRLDMLIDALQPEDPRQARGGAGQQQQPQQGGGGGEGGGGGGGSADGVPPLAQLKIVRALQAEVKERTEEFAQAHPDVKQLSEADKAELDELHRAQSDLAALLEELAAPPPEEPKPGAPPAGEPKGMKIDPLAAMFWLSASMEAGQDPPTPPDRLEKKPRPADATPPDRLEKKPKDEPAKPAEPPKGLKRPDDGVPDPAAQPPVDPEKLRDEIAKDMQSAEKKLKDHDPGAETQKLHDRILNNIDKLLDQARNPPPPPQNQQQQQQQQQQNKGQPPPSGRQQRGSQSQQQQQGSQSRREQRQQRRREREQMARGQPPRPQPGGQQQEQTGEQSQQRQQQAGMNPRGGNAAGPRGEKPSDVIRDIWGHLPETLRQEVDSYYRDQFMPRYRELLQQYYSRLAEQERRGRE